MVAMHGDDLETMLFENAPSQLFERCLKAIFAAHKLAHDECGTGYERTEAENLIPYMRRAKVEGLIRAAAGMVRGVTTSVVKSTNSNWNHTEIRSGCVVVTASAVQTPCALVDPAEFRTTLARSSQGVLWPEFDDEPEPDAVLYAMLLHGKSRWASKEDDERYGHLPGSVYLAIPAPDFASYVHEINLFDRFPAVVEENFPQEWDGEAKISYVARSRKLWAS
jgi:hypothetical protein